MLLKAYTSVSQMEVSEDYASTIAYLLWHLSLCKAYSNEGRFLVHM